MITVQQIDKRYVTLFVTYPIHLWSGVQYNAFIGR